MVRSTTIKEWIFNNFLTIIALLLLAILMLDRCNKSKTNIPQNTRDTTVSVQYIERDGTQNSRPVVINTLPATSISPQYKPDTTYIGVLRQFNKLSQQYFAKNISKDILTIDTLGQVSVTDTVSENKILGRRWDYQLKERLLIKTITNTIYPKPKVKIFTGITLQGNKDNLVNGIDATVLLQNKKDQLYSIGVGATLKGEINYKVGTYFKIKL